MMLAQIQVKAVLADVFKTKRNDKNGGEEIDTV